jgi:hypothetical protein
MKEGGSTKVSKMGNNIYEKMSLEKLNELYHATKRQLKRIEKQIDYKLKLREDAKKAVKDEVAERYDHYIDNYNATISLGLPPTAKYLSRHYYPPMTEHEYLKQILHVLRKADLVHPPDRGQYHPNREVKNNE